MNKEHTKEATPKIEHSTCRELSKDEQDAQIETLLALSFQYLDQEKLVQLTADRSLLTQEELQMLDHALVRYNEYALHLAEVQQKKRHSERRRQMCRAVITWAAAIVLVVFIGGSVVLASSSQLRSQTFNLLFSEETISSMSGISVVFHPDELSEFAVPEDWDGLYYMSYIPDFFELDHIEHYQPGWSEAQYRSGLNQLDFSEIDSSVEFLFPTEDQDVRKTFINGREALIFRSRTCDITSITWSTDDRWFILRVDSPSVDSALAVQIACSVKRIIPLAQERKHFVDMN